MLQPLVENLIEGNEQKRQKGLEAMVIFERFKMTINRKDKKVWREHWGQYRHLLT